MDPPRTEPLDGFTHAVSRYTLAGMTALNTMLYRLTDGTVGGEVPNGGKLLLLTTTGRRSGRRLTVPLLYEPVPGTPDRLAVVASRGGAPEHPAWFHNVEHDPNVEVHVGADVFPARATVATPADREAMWPVLVRRYRYFADYQRRAAAEGGRSIPVVFLDIDRGRAVQWRRASM